MRPELKSPIERGEGTGRGRCEVCGAEGPIVIVPEAPPPNRLCEKCATEYGIAVAEDVDRGP
ncbi:MAG TPA: hypothetical protein VGK67_02200 [Myxococcales bacterium]|jgi:hypothetical protein